MIILLNFGVVTVDFTVENIRKLIASMFLFGPSRRDHDFPNQSFSDFGDTKVLTHRRTNNFFSKHADFGMFQSRKSATLEVSEKTSARRSWRDVSCIRENLEYRINIYQNLWSWKLYHLQSNELTHLNSISVRNSQSRESFQSKEFLLGCMINELIIDCFHGKPVFFMSVCVYSVA